MARLRLTTKAINGGYYKGNRTGSMGRFDKNGNYVIDYKKVRTYVVPEDLKDFKVRTCLNSRQFNDRQYTDTHLAYALCHQTRGGKAKHLQQGDRAEWAHIHRGRQDDGPKLSRAMG